jgi:hypothetical protein
LQQIVVGDRLSDPNWFGVNVNTEAFLPAPPEQIASLTLIDVHGAALEERFASSRHDYQARVSGRGPVEILAWPASSRARFLSIDGKRVKPGVPFRVSFSGASKTIPIRVTAPDGIAAQTYRVTLIH